MWKKLVALFLLLVIGQGILRKWIFTDYSDQLYFVNDIVLFAALCLFALCHRIGLPRELRRTNLPLLIGFYTFWVFLNIFNLRSPSVTVGVFGARAYLLYISLLLLIPVAVRGWDEAAWRRAFLIYVPLIAVPALALGIYQFFQPPTHWINRYAHETREIVAIGGAPRVTGPFPYITGMSTFIIANIGLGFALLIGGFQARNRVLGGLGAALLALALATGPMTGSRSVFVLPAIAVPFLIFRAIQLRLLRASVLFGFVLVALLVTALAQTQLAKAWATFTYRVEGAQDTESRIEDAYMDPLYRIEQVGLIGFGSGTTHQATPQLVPGREPYDWLPDRRFENEKGRIVLELGAIGFGLHLLLFGRLCLLSYAVIRRARLPHESVIGISALFLQLVALLALGTVFDPTAGEIYWMLTALSISAWCRQEVALESVRKRPGFYLGALPRA